MGRAKEMASDTRMPWVAVGLLLWERDLVSSSLELNRICMDRMRWRRVDDCIVANSRRAIAGPCVGLHNNVHSPNDDDDDEKDRLRRTRRALVMRMLSVCPEKS